MFFDYIDYFAKCIFAGLKLRSFKLKKMEIKNEQ